MHDDARNAKTGGRFFGTFALVFAGTGAIVINDVCQRRHGVPGRHRLDVRVDRLGDDLRPGRLESLCEANRHVVDRVDDDRHPSMYQGRLVALALL